MSRARRLAEIAKANQPAFNSDNGTQWWLADPSAKKDPSQPDPMAPPEAEAKPAAEEPARVTVRTTAGQNGRVTDPRMTQPQPARNTVRVSTNHQEQLREAPAEQNPRTTGPQLASRFAGLKERFRALGRKGKS